MNLLHEDANGQCLPAYYTVMVFNYFPKTTLMTCAWMNIPHTYLDFLDYPPFTLK